MFYFPPFGSQRMGHPGGRGGSNTEILRCAQDDTSKAGGFPTVGGGGKRKAPALAGASFLSLLV
jgi:hypothetical protein